MDRRPARVAPLVGSAPPALQGGRGDADVRNVADFRRTESRLSSSTASGRSGPPFEDIGWDSPSIGPDPVGAPATSDALAAPRPTIVAEPTVVPIERKTGRPRLVVVVIVTLAAFSLALGVVVLLLGGGRAKTSPTSGEETTCDDPGAILGSHPTAEGIFQTDLIHALPCAFSSTAWEPAGSQNLVVYLAPLNAHTRSVAEAIIAKDPVPGLASITLKQGEQSFSRGEEQQSAISRPSPAARSSSPHSTDMGW